MKHHNLLLCRHVEDNEVISAKRWFHEALNKMFRAAVEFLIGTIVVCMKFHINIVSETARAT